MSLREMSLRDLRPGFDTNVLTPIFGVMFRDRFDGRIVSAGLKVRLSDPQQPNEAPRQLSTNAYGAFACHRLRGINASGGMASPASTRRYELTVEDKLGRYLPMIVPMTVPADLPQQGLFEPACLAQSPAGETLAAQPHVPLFCAPARSVPAGVGCVRVELRLASAPDQPAAWAWLELRLEADGRILAQGLADQRGCALLLCALPAPVDLPLGGSPAHIAAPLSEWPVRLNAFWSPAIAAATVPDLCALQSLPPVPLLQDLSASPPTPLAPALLLAGSPLVIRASGSSPFVYLAA
ncbi:hypothetical protein [Roseateles sp.]|uniref:hypothetical protein n=1 Tax=Roseateles sp. TaxID=1971397 RepID=UPI00286B190D|nr:hypothetical protein [Roseateles sp.]